MIDPQDITPLDLPRALPALARFRLHEVTEPHEPAFDQAWDQLASFFWAKGELEEREVLRRFVRERRLDLGPGREGTYHLVTAWDGDRLVGVRDCYVDLDLQRGVCVVALSHSYVEPDVRRSGLAALLRALPVTLARRGQQERLGRQLPTLIAAEMEPADPAHPDSVVRLLAYGRSGFQAIDPRRLPYSQPEFRDLPDAPYTAIALLPVVRTVGIEGDSLPVSVLEAFPDLFHAHHRLYLPPERVEPSWGHAMTALQASEAPVPLLPLPVSVDTLDRLAPLVRGAVLPLYPRGLQGPQPEHGDAGEELAQIVARWR